MTGRLTIGELTVVIGYLGAVYGPLSAIAHTTGQLQGALAGAKRVRAHVRADAGNGRGAGRDRRRPASRATFAFEDVGFTYPDGTRVLHDITFAAKPGEDGGAGRPHRRRQDDAGQPDSALLRSDASAASLIDGVDVREYRPALAAREDRHRAAGSGAVRRHDCRQPALRPARRDRRGDRAGGARRARARVHHAAAERLRDRDRARPAAACRAASASG